MKRLGLAAGALLCAATADAQVQFSGPATPGHAPAIVTNSVIKDGGPATQGQFTELGIHKNGGLPLCIADTNNPPPFTGPYAQLCFAISPSMSQIIVNSAGGAVAPPLNYVINGVPTPIATPGNNPVIGGLLTNFATTNLQGSPIADFSGYAASGDGGGGAFANVTSCTPDFGTCFKDVNGLSYKRIAPAQPYIDTWFDTLAHADAAAAAANVPLAIAKNWTLSGATTLASPALIPSGGVIAMNGNNLTLNGQITGPAVQLINVGAFGASGTLTINGGKSIVGNWLCGPWGVSTVDYSPCIQAGFNIIFRNNTNPGPRLFDLESFGSQNTGGIFLNEGLTMNSAYSGIVYDPGMSWVMNPHNTMFYAITTATSGNHETAGWSFIGSPFTTYGWATPVVVIDTQSVVFGFFAGDTSADGNHNIVIDGALMQSGYSFMSTEGSVVGFNGWWSSNVRNIYASDVVGPVIFHNPPTGGAERQNYQNILVINNATSTWPTGLTAQAFVLNSIAGLTLDSWSVDGYGQAGTAVKTPLISMTSVTNCNLSQGHLEQDTLNLSFTSAITFAGSTCRVNGLEAVAIHTSPSSNNSLITVGQNSLVKVDDVSITGTVLGSGSTLYALAPGSDNTSQINVGNLWTQDSVLTGMFNPFLGSGTDFPQQINYPLEVALPSLAINIPSGSTETDLTVGGGPIVGTSVPQGCALTRVTFFTQNALSAGSLTIKLYNYTTLLSTLTIAPANGTSGYLLVSPPHGAAAIKIPAGGLLRTTVTNNAALPTGNQLQVQTSCLGVGG